MVTPAKERRLVLNKVLCKQCGTQLVSYHRHDYKTCGCSNQTMVDGGLSYLRYGGMDMEQVESIPVYMDEPYEKVREAFHWGTYGKEGKGPLKYVPLSSMSNAHILKVASLMTGKMEPWLENLFTKEKAYRKENKIWVEETPAN